VTKAGLSAGEAARRLSAEGPNLLPGSAPKSAFAIVRDVVTEPMFLMLLAAGGIYLALGDRAEALFLLGFVFVVIGITLAFAARRTLVDPGLLSSQSRVTDSYPPALAREHKSTRAQEQTCDHAPEVVN